MTPSSKRRGWIWARALTAASAFSIATLIGAGAASATPTVWAKARDASLDRRLALVAQAESLLMKWRLGSIEAGRDPDAAMKEHYLREAEELLEQAGAETLPDPLVQLNFATVLYDDAMHGDNSNAATEPNGRLVRAVRILERLIHPTNPAYVRCEAWALLALSYGQQGRVADEIRAYGEALKLQPEHVERARLLANRAEAYMLVGDLMTAVSGYRDALASLSSEFLRYGVGVTTLWGLGVALDRSGDLDGGLASITLARAYDAADTHIHDTSSWSFVPPYDEAWYAALGHWAAARHSDLERTRTEQYARAIAKWEEYLARAPATDRWLALAKARLRMCEKERAAAALRYKRATSLRKAPESATE
jgi:hypothetical protein